MAFLVWTGSVEAMSMNGECLRNCGAIARRGEYKVPHGKLVAVTVAFRDQSTTGDAGVAIASVHIDGDFLIDGTDERDGEMLLHELEQTIATHALADSESELEQRLSEVMPRHGGSRLVGTDAHAIAVATSRAILGEREFHASCPDHVLSGHVSCGYVSRDHASRQAGDCESESRDTLTSETAQTTTNASTSLANTSAWQTLQPLILQQQPYEPAMQMALDEVLARAVAAGTMQPALRIWQWASPAVVIGAYQSVGNEVNAAEAEQAGFAVVRRITGGGAMFVQPQDTITYSLYAPLDFAQGLTVTQTYRLCDQWLLDALHSLGIRAESQPINDIGVPQGGKIGGAAERRFPVPSRRSVGRSAGGHQSRGCLLHHVTMAYGIDAGRMTRILRVSAEKMKDKAVRSARKRVEPLNMQTSLSRDQLAALLEQYALQHMPSARRASVPSQLLDEAVELARSKYSNPTWTYRIA